MSVEKVIGENVNNSRKAYYFLDDISVAPAPPAFPKDDFTSVLFGSCYELEKLHFETDKAVILPESYDELNGLAGFLKKYPFVVVYIDGHTDIRGTDLHNDSLSERRATAVKNYLVANGVQEGRLKARGYGESAPIDTENANSLANRRVEITICEAKGLAGH
jgi:outer membrane protein OmpA-like peptidoglycan-associated protein